MPPKRKASVSVAPGGSVAASQASDPLPSADSKTVERTQLQQTQEDHRRYLLEAIGGEAELPPPPAKKEKTPKRIKKTRADVQDNGTRRSESDAAVARNAGDDTPETQTSRKRKAGELTEDSTPDSYKSSGSKHDSLVSGETEVAAANAKPAPKRRKTRVAAEQPAVDSEDTPATPSVKKFTKKALQPVATLSPYHRQDDDQVTGDPPPTKKPKRVPKDTKKPRKKKVEAATQTSDEKLELPVLPVAPLSSCLAAKVRQVYQFLHATPGEQTVLQRPDKDHPQLIHMSELTLHAALMKMCVDYELDIDPYAATTALVEEAIVEDYLADVRETSNLPWVVFDASKETRCEREIHEKLSGHGLEDVNLIELEVEMGERGHISMISEVQILRAGYDEARQIVDADIASKAYAHSIKNLARVCKEALPRRGVCPAPIAES